MLLTGLNINNILYSLLIALLVSLISFILLKRVKFEEKEEEKVNFEKYIKEDDIFINKMYKFQKNCIYSIIYSKYFGYNILFISRKYLIIVYLLFYFDLRTIYRSFNRT